jgi:hypothetical protein
MQIDVTHNSAFLLNGSRNGMPTYFYTWGSVDFGNVNDPDTAFNVPGFGNVGIFGDGAKMSGIGNYYPDQTFGSLMNWDSVNGLIQMDFSHLYDTSVKPIVGRVNLRMGIIFKKSPTNSFDSSSLYMLAYFDIVPACPRLTAVSGNRSSSSQILLKWSGSTYVRIEKSIDGGRTWVLLTDKYTGSTFTDVIADGTVTPDYRIYNCCVYSGGRVGLSPPIPVLISDETVRRRYRSNGALKGL